jgi:hypothetical protein
MSIPDYHFSKSLSADFADFTWSLFIHFFARGAA